MNLVIDIGNTKVKTGLYEHNILRHFFIFDKVDDIFRSKEIKDVIRHIDAAIASNVSDAGLYDVIKNYFHYIPFYQVSATLKLPFKIDYESPPTLGSDRIASVAGALNEFSDTPILVIDFGTCIKYNFISQKIFLGGAIAPGLNMRFQSLHHYTEKLPFIEIQEKYLQKNITVIGKNTQDNLYSGVINGCLAEVRYFIDYAMNTYGHELKIVITGGNANFFEKLIERKVFLRPYLILNGLNDLLEYQK